MGKKSFYDHIEEISDKISEIFEEYNEDEHPGLAEFIAVEATLNGADNVYQGIGILDVSKRHYEECILESDDEDDSEGNVVKFKPVNLN